MGAGYEVIGRWVIDSEYGQERTVRSGVSEILSKFNADPLQVEDILTTVSEACLNAMEHGNGLDKNRKVSVVLMSAGNKLVFQVLDEGGGCVPPAVPITRREKLMADNPRGWGMYLMSALADQVNYRWELGQFCVEIHFNRK